MNREDASKLWPIVKAFGEGQEIEDFRNTSRRWAPSGESCGFTSRPSKYRIKPKPREFWLDLTDKRFIEAGKGSKYWGEENELIKVREFE